METWKKTFAVIWSGQLFSTLSSSVVGYAVIFWLSIETGSAEILAFSFIATFLPQLLLGPFTGVFIDRWDRKRIMILADIFIAVCSAVMAVLFALGQVRIPYIYLLLALRSVAAPSTFPPCRRPSPCWPRSPSSCVSPASTRPSTRRATSPARPWPPCSSTPSA